jgi:cytochrome b
MSESTSPDPIRVRVWDVPTRLVHWLMAVLVTFSWWTAETGRMAWHQYSGYSLLALVCFRIYWGFFGSSTARFRRFVRGPGVVVSYLQGRWAALPGHNPLGALSVLALLVLLATQIALGLFAVDVDGIESGPLSMFVSFEAGRVAAKWHHRLFDALTWLIGLHVAAVLFYVFVKKENLIGAMLHGKRRFDREHESLQPVSAIRVVVGALLASALTWMVARAFQFG